MQSQRPPNPHQRIIDDLKEAFPNIDGPVIKAVVVASDGNVEKAFNALLGEHKTRKRRLVVCNVWWTVAKSVYRNVGS